MVVVQSPCTGNGRSRVAVYTQRTQWGRRMISVGTPLGRGINAVQTQYKRSTNASTCDGEPTHYWRPHKLYLLPNK